MTAPIGPTDSSVVPRYAGAATFARLPRADQVDSFDVAVLGVPFDSGVSYRPGARFGPAHIRESSRLLRPYNPVQKVHPFATQQVVDAGDLAVNPYDIQHAVKEIQAGGRGPHQRRCPAADHRRRPHGRAAAAACRRRPARTRRGRPLRRPPRHLGHLLRRAVHPWHPLPPRERGGPPRHERLRPRRHPRSAVLRPRSLRRRGAGLPDRGRARRPRTSAGEASSSASRTGVGDRPVYVSIDIDVLDPAFAPGTGTPEAGGLSSRELLQVAALLRRPPARRCRHRRGGAGLRPRPDHRHRGSPRRLRAHLGDGAHAPRDGAGVMSAAAAPAAAQRRLGRRRRARRGGRRGGLRHPRHPQPRALPGAGAQRNPPRDRPVTSRASATRPTGTRG